MVTPLPTVVVPESARNCPVVVEPPMLMVLMEPNALVPATVTPALLVPATLGKSSVPLRPLLSPDSVTAPGPVFEKPLVPTRGALMMGKRLRISSTGLLAPLSRVRLLVPAKIQLLLGVVRSCTDNVPRVTGVSNVTVVSAVISKVLKLAVAPAPPATAPPDQLTVAL